jgi:uncharacterized protein (UPF0335 family)
MKDFVSKILAGNLTEAKEALKQHIERLVDEKLEQTKQKIADDIYGKYVAEGIRNVLKTGRTKIVRVRIRKGKIQRRKKLSGVKGWTFRGGKLTRMSPLERRNRKVAAKRSKFKRRAKLRQSIRKRSMSLRKRRAMGL